MASCQMAKETSTAGLFTAGKYREEILQSYLCSFALCVLESSFIFVDYNPKPQLANVVSNFLASEDGVTNKLKPYSPCRPMPETWIIPIPLTAAVVLLSKFTFGIFCTKFQK